MHVNGHSASPLHAPVRRDVHIDFSRCDFSKWHGGGEAASHFFNAFSAFFPLGEKFFVHSVRPYRRVIDKPALAQAVASFMGQEAMHSREHYSYISAMEDCGYPMKTLDVRLFGRPLNDIPEIERLATTAAMEHLTAAVSRLVLETSWAVRGDPDICRVWFWHAVEELEHKSVIMNVFNGVIDSSAKRYRLRVQTAIRAAFNFIPRLLANQVKLLRVSSQQGSLRCWARVCWHAFIFPGMLVRLAPDFFRYMIPGFHPDCRNDDYLLSAGKQHASTRDIFNTEAV